MRVLVLVSQKGGSGKSSLATSLAVAAMQAGEAVLAVDLDPQGTLKAWASLRTDKTLPIAALPAARTDQLGDLVASAAGRFSTLIVDTAGVDNETSRKAIAEATFCLIPLRPTRPDGLAIQPTVKAVLGAGKKFAFILNQAPTTARSTRASEMATGLASIGLLAEPVIHQRVEHQDAFSAGLGVTEYAPDGRASDEIRSLWSWIYKATKET